jgi:hypothetical protein
MKGLVLRPEDVGREFVVRSTLTGARALAESPPGDRVPAGLVKRLAGLGRIGGRQVDLVRAATAAGLQEGPLELVSSASVYSSAAGAHAGFVFARSLVPRYYAPVGVDYPLGDEAHEWVRQGSSSVGAILVYFVLWRDRTVVASLAVVGRVGVVSAADVAPAARAQQARILAALGP